MVSAPLHSFASYFACDKLDHGYIKIYEEVFAPYRESQNNFLEIGIYQGRSVGMWASYFTASQLIFMDIFDKSPIFKRDSGPSFFQGDSGSPVALESLMDFIEEKTGRRELDCVIDDGSHFQHDQQIALGHLFKYVKPGGVYIIEDICQEEALRNGSLWWGDSSEPHAAGGECHVGSSLRSDEEWLAGPKVDFANCTDAVIKGFLDDGVFSSKYLSPSENDFLTDNIDYGHYYDRSSGLTCDASLVFLYKKKPKEPACD
tara:strand:+ start:212 stop:988 length:777 start_codon:yes stop_codon:yes gene_type:complete